MNNLIGLHGKRVGRLLGLMEGKVVLGLKLGFLVGPEVVGALVG